MNVNAVTHLNSDLAQVFVAAVHGVAQLQGGYIAPAAIFEQLAGLGRTMVDAGILGGIVAFAEHLDRAGQVDRFLLHDHLDAGVVFFGDLPEFFGGGGAFAHEDLLAFPCLVGFGQLEFFGDLHGGHDLVAFGIVEGNFITIVDGGRIFLAHVEAHRYRPEGAVGGQEVFADAFPVGLGHEPGQRAEAADTDHDQIAFDARGDLYFFETFGFFLFSFQFSTFEQTDSEALATMRGNKIGHVFVLLSIMWIS